MTLQDKKLCVVGLGYVGLPLAVAFARHMKVIGFDIDANRVESCAAGIDPSHEVAPADLHAVMPNLELTTRGEALREADLIIVAVPTPIDDAKQPDFRPLIGASRSVGANMKHGAIVIFESTVYPGATEEICIPELETASGLKWKKDFHVGYSPERINPGDKERRLATITKVVSGDDEATLEMVAALYELVVAAGVYRAESIMIAEAAKVIENTQRDLNIALMNELAIIFHRANIDTQKVLKAAGTKWNFLPFRPGLVGGHCIGVDPYYLTYKAEQLGYHPQVILAGRRINDGMGLFIVQQAVKKLISAGFELRGATALVLGVTFKENCPDIRNTRSVDIVRELHEYGIKTILHDPLASDAEFSQEYGLRLARWDQFVPAEMMIVAVAHNEYQALTPARLREILKPGACIVDVKSVLDKESLQDAGYQVWRL